MKAQQSWFFFENLSAADRRMFLEKILDVANIAVGTLFFSQLVSRESAQLGASVLGLVILSICYVFVIIIIRKSSK